MSRRKKPKEKLTQTAKSWFSMPPKGFYQQPVIHMDCRGWMEIENCTKVLLYTQNEVEIEIGGQVVRIHGEELKLGELAGKNLFLQGIVFEIEFKQNS